MDDLFDNTMPPIAEQKPREKEMAGKMTEDAPVQNMPLADAQALPSQSGAAGVLREIRALAAQPLPPLTRGEKEISTDAFGSTLRSLRERNNLSIETLSQRTLISVTYIKALENEDYKHLPPPVYVSAYIRRLGSLYGLSEQELASLTAKVRAMMAYELPKELDKTTISYEDDEENDERLRRMFWGAAIAFAVVAAVTISGILLWVAHPSHKGGNEIPVVEAGTEPFRIAELVDRRPAVRLNNAVLPPAGAIR